VREKPLTTASAEGLVAQLQIRYPGYWENNNAIRNNATKKSFEHRYD